MRPTLVPVVVLLCLAWRTDAALPRLQDTIKNALSMSVTAQPEDLFVPEPTQYKNPKPMIGILSQACHYCPGKFYESEAELRRLFKSTNGIILPGGLTDLWLDDPYVLAAKKLLQWATEENEKGGVYPVWGTCLGHQLQMILTANVDFNDLLITTDAVSCLNIFDKGKIIQAGNVNFTADSLFASCVCGAGDTTPFGLQAHASSLKFYHESNRSRIFGNMNAKLKAKLEDSRYNIAMENHEFGVAPEAFTKWPILNDTYDIVSTSKDRNGAEYISTIEHMKYPFFGTQWHPEKPPYEFSMDAIPHSKDAVHVSQHLADVFVDYARQSDHKPESKEEELAMLIYNYKPIFTARDIVMEPSYDGPDITYFFDPQESEDVDRAVNMGPLA